MGLFFATRPTISFFPFLVAGSYLVRIILHTLLSLTKMHISYPQGWSHGQYSCPDDPLLVKRRVNVC